jgi:hypothetical protein
MSIKYKPKPMTKGQFASLKSLIDYTMYDEKMHWEQTGKPDTGHIYNDIQRLHDYMYQCEQFVESSE